MVEPVKVLIISDEPTVRQKLRVALDGLKFEVLEAAGVDRAAACMSAKPAVAIVVEGEGERGKEVLQFINCVPPGSGPSRTRVMYYVHGDTPNDYNYQPDVVALKQDLDSLPRDLHTQFFK